MEPLVFPFDAGHDRASGELVALLGGKGAGLARMSAAGLPVPPGFTLTTDACRRFLASGWSQAHDDAVREGISGLEKASAKTLGDPSRPLLVSVRSGASVSMPGMMDTVLNVGMSDEVEGALATETNDAEFAADTHRRALVSFAGVVSGASPEVIERAGAAGDPAAVRQALADDGIVVPTEPIEQVVAAVRAVLESWNSDRAARYREIEGLDSSAGTAATVQAMVFGNLGSDSGTGVAFTRDPSSGAPGLMGDFLVGAQGEDVVAGDHPTRPLGEMAARWPDAWAELERIAAHLELDYADMVDIEFTVERRVLWMLQVRRAKRSPLAAVRVATQMADDPDFPLDRDDAVTRCLPQLEDPPLVGDTSTDNETGTDGTDTGTIVIGSGLAAAPGRAVGVLCLDVDRAVELEAAGVDVILARPETSPSDVAGIAAARGLVTTLGGLVSHAAVLARAWGLPTVVGAAELTLEAASLSGPGGRVEVGAIVTVDGDNGRLLAGSHPLEGHIAPEVSVLRQWQANVVTRDAPDTAPAPANAPRGENFAVLHALRIKGMATPAVLTGMLDADVSETLAGCVGTGLVRHIEARDFYQLTDEGREVHARLLTEATSPLELDSLRYDEFLTTNVTFKELCTDWQLRDGTPNDHADSAYDQDVMQRLVDSDRAAEPLLESFAEIIPWTGRYRDRLAGARDRLLAGDLKALTGVMCDSYHDIWMELHEDLLLTQGISRASEESG